MKKPFFLLAILLTSINSFATNVSGLISANTTWTKANSPYIITGDIDVDTGATLTIEPSVHVLVSGKYTIYVDGKINAIGTSSDSIYFSATPVSTSWASWEGIYIRHSNVADTFSFDYCSFQNAHFAINSKYNPARVTHSYFHNNSICFSNNYGSGSYTYVSYCNFQNNDVAIQTGGFSHVLNNVMAYCNTAFQGGADVINNTIYHCKHGINGGKIINNNIVTYCDYEGIVANGATATYNQVWYCKIGVIFSGGGSLVQHNGIMYNDTGVVTRTYDSSGNNISYNCIVGSKKLAFKSSGMTVNIDNNYFGETDSAKIAAIIYDFYDDFTLTKLQFMPVLSSKDSGCADSINVPGNTTKVPVVENTIDVSVYPNPASSTLTIDAGIQTIQEVFICNMAGSLIYHSTSPKTKLTIDASTFPNGVYLYKVVLKDNTIQAGKVLKE